MGQQKPDENTESPKPAEPLAEPENPVSDGDAIAEVGDAVGGPA